MSQENLSQSQTEILPNQTSEYQLAASAPAQEKGHEWLDQEAYNFFKGTIQTLLITTCSMMTLRYTTEQKDECIAPFLKATLVAIADHFRSNLSEYKLEFINATSKIMMAIEELLSNQKGMINTKEDIDTVIRYLAYVIDKSLVELQDIFYDRLGRSRPTVYQM